MVQEVSTPVDRLYYDFTRILERIEATDLSLRTSAEEIFQKSLYVAIGSYFEQRVTRHILEFVSESSEANLLVTEFVRNKAIGRQYHTLFGWTDNNANSFFRLFGNEFRTYMADYVRNDPGYAEAAKAFLEIGNVRNEVAHEFSNVSLNKSSDDIYSRYRDALVFVEQIPLHFEAFLANRQDPDSE